MKDGLPCPIHKFTFLTALKEEKRTDKLRLVWVFLHKGANNHEELCFIMLFKHRYDGMHNISCKKHLGTNSYRVHHQLRCLSAGSQVHTWDLDHLWGSQEGTRLPEVPHCNANGDPLATAFTHSFSDQHLQRQGEEKRFETK